jgi:hypothetical protein
MKEMNIFETTSMFELEENWSQEQDLEIWNRLGVVVNWLLGKLLGACKIHL